MAQETAETRDAHLPRQVPIDAYGNGGFRFGGMSHRGSLLCLPSGLYGWTGTAQAPFSGERLLKALEESEIRFMLFGTGAAKAARFNAAGMSCDAMSTGAAVRTYNIMLLEGRPVGAALVAVD